MSAIRGSWDFDWQGTLQKHVHGGGHSVCAAGLSDMNGLVGPSYAGKFASDDLTPPVPGGAVCAGAEPRAHLSAFKDGPCRRCPGW